MNNIKKRDLERSKVIAALFICIIFLLLSYQSLKVEALPEKEMIEYRNRTESIFSADRVRLPTEKDSPETAKMFTERKKAFTIYAYKNLKEYGEKNSKLFKNAAKAIMAQLEIGTKDKENAILSYSLEQDTIYVGEQSLVKCAIETQNRLRPVQNLIDQMLEDEFIMEDIKIYSDSRPTTSFIMTLYSDYGCEIYLRYVVPKTLREQGESVFCITTGWDVNKIVIPSPNPNG